MLKQTLCLSVASLALLGFAARDAAAADNRDSRQLQIAAATPSKAAATPSALPLTPQVISGTVTSPHGPEAGVWVIAETTELPTKFVKIVVTDDKGRYLLPELPRADYSVWVRG